MTATRKIEIAVLTFVCRLLLLVAAPVAHALGRRLPGEIPTFAPPKVDLADTPDDESGLYGCTKWR